MTDHAGRFPGNLAGPVRIYVKRLRRKLGEDAGSPKYILPQLRVGYRMPKGETRVEEIL